MGPSKVGPLYRATFSRCYRPPFGVRVWSPDVLTSYVVFVPKMVCFFEVAFDNGLRFPLHPFIKEVLQHFNVCPSQLSPNCWGILVGVLVFFRDRGLGVPNIALLLYLFSAKETAEGFLYFSRRTSAPLVIFDLPSSHRLWKEHYFFVSGRNWEYNPLDKDDTLGVPVTWTTLENLRECRFVFSITCMRLLDISNFALSTCLSGDRPRHLQKARGPLWARLGPMGFSLAKLERPKPVKGRAGPRASFQGRPGQAGWPESWAFRPVQKPA